MPCGFKQLVGFIIRNMAITGEFMWKRTHITRTLNVILPAQRIHSNANPAQITRSHRQIGNADNRGGALASKFK
jgi:hypothetical protein